MVESMLNQEESPKEWFKYFPNVTPEEMRDFGRKIKKEITDLESHITQLKHWLEDVASLQANECVKNE